jgi:hypothetical protein
VRRTARTGRTRHDRNASNGFRPHRAPTRTLFRARRRPGMRTGGRHRATSSAYIDDDAFPDPDWLLLPARCLHERAGGPASGGLNIPTCPRGMSNLVAEGRRQGAQGGPIHVLVFRSRGRAHSRVWMRTWPSDVPPLLAIAWLRSSLPVPRAYDVESSLLAPPCSDQGAVGAARLPSRCPGLAPAPELDPGGGWGGVALGGTGASNAAYGRGRGPPRAQSGPNGLQLAAGQPQLAGPASSVRRPPRRCRPKARIAVRPLGHQPVPNRCTRRGLGPPRGAFGDDARSGTSRRFVLAAVSALGVLCAPRAAPRARRYCGLMASRLFLADSLI